jgi:hypothetical protein
MHSTMWRHASGFDHPPEACRTAGFPQSAYRRCKQYWNAKSPDFAPKSGDFGFRTALFEYLVPLVPAHEDTRMAPPLCRHSAFHNLRAALRCGYRYGPAADPKSASDIWTDFRPRSGESDKQEIGVHQHNTRPGKFPI